MIVFLTGPGMGFPNGTAPTVRTALYARGLAEQGIKVRVLCLGPSEYPNINVLNHEAEGIWNGVHYEYTSGTPIRGRNRFHQLWLVFLGLTQAFHRLLKLNKMEQIEAIILYSDWFPPIIISWLAARICKSIYLFERCEQPFLKAESSKFWSTLAATYTHLVYKFFDGAIVISDYLHDYMRKRLRSSAQLLKIPILVDSESFTHSKIDTKIKGSYIAYSGMLNEHKDGVLTLMKAFQRISGELPETKLVLIGDSIKQSQIPTFRAYAEELGISERVIFTGLVSRAEIPDYLSGASVLALARPRSKQAEAGFPTKLGEYLATGNPVVITRTGEIDHYLTDMENVLFAEPNSVDDFADKLRFALNNPEVANEIGNKGREIARERFDFRANGKRLKDFIDRFTR